MILYLTDSLELQSAGCLSSILCFHDLRAHFELGQPLDMQALG